jgi:superoxide dismutase, Fe-Mn family
VTHPTRRQVLHAAGAGLAAVGLAPLHALAADKDKEPPKGFTLPDLPYAYDALEPSIDKETMQIHHDKHHAAYVKNLNDALKDHPDLLAKNVVDILKDVKQVPEDVRQTVINNGGGHANHSMFWLLMAPKGKGGEPSGALKKALESAFDSLDKFQEKINTAGAKRFGSGWAWLVYDPKMSKLDVISTANQDSPYLDGRTPLLGVDVWEHAYYLKYHQDRAAYLKAWWDVVNWKYVADRYDEATKKG